MKNLMIALVIMIMVASSVMADLPIGGASPPITPMPNTPYQNIQGVMIVMQISCAALCLPIMGGIMTIILKLVN